MTTNLYQRLLDLSPKTPLLIGEVLSTHGDNTSTVEFPDGTTQRVRGVSVAVGQAAFVRNGVIEGVAPARTAVTIEI